MIDGVNPQIIQNLGRDLDNQPLALRFLTDFLAMLPQRFTRIKSAVDARDREDAMDAILSLKITAAMAGAAKIADVCNDLQSAIKNRDFAHAQEQLQQLNATVVRLNDAARSFSGQEEPFAPGVDLLQNVPSPER